MNKIKIIVGVIFLSLMLNSPIFSQSLSKEKYEIIEPCHLEVTYYKTTSLVFPFPVKSVDRGSSGILVQKAKEVDNIIQVKAGEKGFEETNLSVVTSDGKLYCFTVNYADKPEELTLVFNAADEVNATGNVKGQAVFSSGSPNEDNIQSSAKWATFGEKNIHGVKSKKYGIKVKLTGLYIGEGVMYFQIKMNNTSDINYDIARFRFSIHDQKIARRTASQEIELTPLYIYGDTATISHQGNKVFVFAFPKFTIPDKKYLLIQLTEKNGGRHLRLKIHNNEIIKAKRVTL